MVEHRKQGRGWNGQFLGFRAKKNCEDMPIIDASIVRANLDDPRRIPYLLVWKDERHDDEIMEAVRLARFVGTFDDHVELKRTNGSTTVLRIIWRTLLRNGGRGALPAKIMRNWWRSRTSTILRTCSASTKTSSRVRQHPQQRVARIS